MTPRQYGLCSMLLETETNSIICGKAFDKKKPAPPLFAALKQILPKKSFPNCSPMPASCLFLFPGGTSLQTFQPGGKKLFGGEKALLIAETILIIISDLLDNLPKVAGEQVCQS